LGHNRSSKKELGFLIRNILGRDPKGYPEASSKSGGKRKQLHRVKRWEKGSRGVL